MQCVSLGEVTSPGEPRAAGATPFLPPHIPLFSGERSWQRWAMGQIERLGRLRGVGVRSTRWKLALEILPQVADLAQQALPGSWQRRVFG